MRLPGLFVALALIAQPVSGLAQEDDQAYAITDLNPHADCTAASAHPVDLHELARHPNRYGGQCVQLSGIVSGWSVFDRLDSLYVLGVNSGAGNPAGRIGLYPQAVSEGLHGVVQADVVGVAGDCEGLSGPNVIMVLGYCHHYAGAYIVVSQLTATSDPLSRRVGAADRRRIGDLGAAPTAWRDLSTVANLAERWLRSIEQGDVGEFARLEGRHVEDMQTANAQSDEHVVFAAPDGPFVQFRGAHSTPQMAIFVRKRAGLDAPSLARVREDREAWACFCREADCREAWPISIHDTANDAARPFICAHIYDGGDASTPFWVVTTDIWANGLAEPR